VPNAFRATISEVQTVVAEVHAITREALKSSSRRRVWAHPRQEAMMLAREMTGCSYPQIAYHFGDRDHTTVLYADRKICALETRDAKLAKRLDECRERIKQLVYARLGRMPGWQTAGSSSEWSPPPPLRIAKPDVVVASIDHDAWQALSTATGATA